MSLQLRNALSNANEPFVPMDPEGKQVLLYSCGPTVYGFAHIGNFRSFLMSDVLRRTLERRGYTVRHVMNITDVGHMTEDHIADADGEDKLVKAAREIGKDPYEVAQYFEDAFVADAKRLKLRLYEGDEADNAEQHPRATRHVPHMLAMIQTLIERGHAYLDSEGQVYFSVESFPAYGDLSGKILDDLQAGARVAVRDEKRDPRDFALWKVDPKHLMQWDPHTPAGWRDPDDYDVLEALCPQGVDPLVGRGFPGWHIECSAMSRSSLADVIDIHTGGEDNLFPHHECENAQSVCALGCTVPGPDGSERPSFSKYWLHCRFLLVNGKKMSKRDGTFFTVRELLDPSAHGRPELADELRQAGFTTGKVPRSVLRLALVSSSFGRQLNFTVGLMQQARKIVDGMQGLHHRMDLLAGGAAPEHTDATRGFLTAMDRALDDSLNMSNVLDAVVALYRDAPIGAQPGEAAAYVDALLQADSVLAVLELQARTGGTVTLTQLESGAEIELPESIESLDAKTIEALLGARHRARKSRDFARADAIRALLTAAGVQVMDAKGEVTWKIQAGGLD